jgi:Na+/melibiose symporter-like transporter
MTGGLPTQVRTGYALGSVVTGVFTTVPGLLLLPYLTDTLGIAAGLGGLVVLLPKAWDVLLNPIAGRRSDRSGSRLGPRRPYLLGGGAVVAVLFAAMFAGPVRSGPLAAGYVAAAFLIGATGFAFFQVPYVAMPAEMTDDYHERTHLMTWRVAVLSVAILLSGAVAPVIVNAAGHGIPGHRAMGLAFGALIVLGTVGVFVGTRHAPTGPLTESEPSLRVQLGVARHNQAFVVLLGCWVIQAAAVGTMLASVSYFAVQVLHSQAAKTILFVCLFGPAVLVMPLWLRVARRMGKRRGYVVASLLFAAGAVLLLIGHQAPVAYVCTAVIGTGYIGQQVYGMAMLPDCIAADATRTGRRQAGVFTGLWTAGETLGLALGPGIFGLVLQLSGYVSTSSGEALAQSGTARLGILLGATLLPAAMMVVALPLLRSYRDAFSLQRGRPVSTVDAP